MINQKAHIYIMEYKMGTAEAALNQIKEKKYYEKYFKAEKPITLIGIGFDMEQKNIDDFKIEEIGRR